MNPESSTCHHRLLRLAAIFVLSWVAAAGAASAQPPSQPQPPGVAGRAGRGDQSGPAEIQRLFDAYIVIRAQEALNLDDEQFTQFLPKLRALQETRRRNDQAHNQLVAELARLTAPAAQFDEAQVRDKLKALQELDGRAAAELRKAYEAVDQGLDMRRQARFRVFELQMERRKLELVLQARRADAVRQKQPEAPIKKLAPLPASSKQIRVP